MKIAEKKHPTRLIRRDPRISAMAPERRTTEPLARGPTELGQRRRFAGRDRSFAIVGRPIVTRPPLKFVMKFTATSWAITMIARRFVRLAGIGVVVAASSV